MIIDQFSVPVIDFIIGFQSLNLYLYIFIVYMYKLALYIHILILINHLKKINIITIT